MKSDNAYMHSKLGELERKQGMFDEEVLKGKEKDMKLKKMAEENQFIKMQVESLNR